jgi:LemA protein
LLAIETDKLSSFELDRKLVSLTREFYNLKFEHREIGKEEGFTHMDFILKDNEAELDGYTTYYNDNIAKYNKLVRMFPSNIVAKLARFKERTFYDGKNMNDKNINDFKL